MNWDKIKEALHLDKLNSSDMPAGAFCIASIIVLLVAIKSGKLMFKLLFGLVALALIAAAVWWHLHQR